MELIASPCSWSWVNVLTSITWCPVCCLDMFHKDLCPPPSCQPLEKWCTSQKKLKDKLFWICLATHPRKSGTLPLQTTPHPRARRAALVPVVDRGVVTSLIELCINDILENQKPLSLFSSNCVPPFSCCFRFLLKFSALKKFTTTGAGYGPLPRANRYAI